MIEKKLVVAIFKKFFIALIPTLLFGVMALIPTLGNAVVTRVYFPIEKRYEFVDSSEFLYGIVNFNCNATFSPFLYPVSWALGRGVVSGNFSMIYLPHWVGGYTGDQAPAPYWGKPKAIEGEATMKVVIEEFLLNLPLVFVIFFAIELVEIRKLYAWFLGGVMGFVFGVGGVVAGFLVAVFSTSFLLPKLRKPPRELKESL